MGSSFSWGHRRGRRSSGVGRTCLVQRWRVGSEDRACDGAVAAHAGLASGATRRRAANMGGGG
eukprot:2726254-Pyramimonas_sp.AAC.1